jgi:two-component system, cell cycle response regulator DivK
LILVVDDIPDNRQMYAEYLEFEGYRVEQAATGAEAVAVALDLHPNGRLGSHASA